MTRKAFIKLVPTSIQTAITKDELKALFHYYKEITSKTGSQIDWMYDQAAFPYDIKEDLDQQNNSFYLYSKQDRYHLILIGIEQEIITDENGDQEKQTYIRVTLPSSSTYGDKGKANEFCKFVAKQLHGDLQLFNGRVMYFSR